MTKSEKILLTGVCYVHRLLQLRYDRANQIDRRNYIDEVHPDFDLTKVNFFREQISEQFVFTDFHGKFSSLETEANSLPELLNLYAPHCRRMYVVGAMGINKKDVAVELQPKDIRKLSAFWYFLFDENWNPHKVNNWANDRNRAIHNLLVAHPQLRFILYEKRCYEWWLKAGLPASRVLWWEIDWGMNAEQYEEIRQELLARGIGGGHRFPTEDSYNELCEMILKDCR